MVKTKKGLQMITETVTAQEVEEIKKKQTELSWTQLEEEITKETQGITCCGVTPEPLDTHWELLQKKKNKRVLRRCPQCHRGVYIKVEEV